MDRRLLMEIQQLREVLKTSLRGYQSIALDAGLPFVDLTDEQLAEMSISDIERHVKQLQVLLRTPH
jgi:hypothetical protein